MAKYISIHYKNLNDEMVEGLVNMETAEVSDVNGEIIKAALFEKEGFWKELPADE